MLVYCSFLAVILPLVVDFVFYPNLIYGFHWYVSAGASFPSRPTRQFCSEAMQATARQA